MRSLAFAPFALSVVVVVLGRVGVHRLRPRAASWAMSVAAAAVAVSTVGALVVLACPLPARIPAVAALGRWQAHTVALRSPVPAWISTVALSALAWIGWRAAVEMLRLERDLVDIGRAHAELADCGGGEVIVIDDPVPRAHAVSGTINRRGRVLVSTAMLELLDDQERAAVVAHERSHLRHRHGVFLGVMRLTTALNPLLGPMGPDLQFTLERWADEDAATATHRTVIASALAKAALAMLHITVPGAAPAGMSLHNHAVAERVAALLDRRVQRSCLAWALLATAAVAAASLVWSLHDTERFFEAVRLWHHR